MQTSEPIPRANEMSMHANLVVALHWHANYFGVSRLTKDLDDALPYEISYWTDVLVNAMKLQLEEIVNAVISLSAKSIWWKDMSDLVTAFDAHFLICFLKEKKDDESASRDASRFVVAFCDKHQVDAETFEAATDAALLPHIDHKAALSLLEKERELLPNQSPSLSSLQERCLDAIARNVRDFDLDEDSLLFRQSSTFAIKLLIKHTHYLIGNANAEE
jgi:hypothetical protein